MHTLSGAGVLTFDESTLSSAQGFDGWGTILIKVADELMCNFAVDLVFIVYGYETVKVY